MESYKGVKIEKILSDKDIRLRYVRGLEKFVRSNYSYLKEPEFKFEIFQKRVKKTFELLKKIKSIRLDSTYPVALENYVNLILSVLHVEDLDEEKENSFKAKLLKEANLLHKEKNNTRYKKDKHKTNKFNDGY